MPMARIKDRLIAVRQALGISQKDFCRGIYLSQGYYAQIEGETRSINNRIVALISSKYNVNREWLLSGKGEMFSDELPDMELSKLLDIFSELDPLFREYLMLQIKQLLEVQTKSKKQGSK
jgi:transcriptional regulator with XRE-family HTH domain